MGIKKLGELHKVTTFTDLIFAPNKKKPCVQCTYIHTFTKIKIKKGQHVSNGKAASLSLILIDVCGTLLTS